MHTDLSRRAPAARPAFTLVEVLTVLAIIAVLIALLMPALRQARERAQEVTCAASLRSLDQVGLMYANSNAGKLPELQLDTGSTAYDPSINIYWVYGSWRTYLQTAYGVQRNMWYSPSATTLNQDKLYYYLWNGHSDPNATRLMITGRFYFSSLANSDPFYHAFKAAYRPPATSRPVFPTTLSSRSYSPMVWADIDREYPAISGQINWLTPADTQGGDRIGASHLYGPVTEMPAGAHVANLDGSVSWTPGDQLQYRASYGGSALWW